MAFRLQLIVLGAATLGAFLARLASEQKPTVSWGTLWYVLSTGVVTYLALDSGMVPDAWQAAALANPVRAGSAAFILAGLGGAVLVGKAQDLIDGIMRRKP